MQACFDTDPFKVLELTFDAQIMKTFLLVSFNESAEERHFQQFLSRKFIFGNIYTLKIYESYFV
jgi:1-deoxy-D-xylulose 5-phosphate reductoisomerase